MSIFVSSLSLAFGRTIDLDKNIAPAPSDVEVVLTYQIDGYAAEVYWSAPENAFWIESYTVDCASSDEHFIEVVNGKVNFALVSGLSSGKEYVCSVTAIDKVLGAGVTVSSAAFQTGI